MSDLQLERLSSKPTVAGVASPRSILAVQPNDPAVSIQPLAVTPVSYTQPSNTNDHFQHASSHAIGQIRNEGAVLASNEERRKQINAILERLLGNKDRLARGEAAFIVGKRVSDDVSDLVDLEQIISSSTENDDGLLKTLFKGPSQSEPDVFERARVLRKIEAALKRLDNLKAALLNTDEQAYARLVNINVSESGLAAARVQLGESHFGTISASSTVDTLMSNLRAVVIAAHGRMTPELVRLVFP